MQVAGTPTIPLKDVTPAQAHAAPHPAEPPYRLFLSTALVLALVGGFSLALLLSLAGALEWDWGSRWPELVQAHGQIQLIGFAGLFIVGMALRMMPRFSGRPLGYRSATPAIAALIGGGIALRGVAPLLGDGPVNDVAFVGGPALVLAGAFAFWAITVRLLVHPESKAEATGWFFVLGASGYLASAALLLILTVRALDDDTYLLPALENTGLLGLELYGAILLFIGGVLTRAAPTFVGRPRSQIVARTAAALLSVSAATYAGVMLYIAEGHRSESLYRLATAALIAISIALLLVVWASGVLHPRANRVAAASQKQFWFLRAGCAWLTASSLLTMYYAVRALADGALLDQFELDAVRHMLTVGVVTMLIMGMAMLVVPEFAGRRLQHPDERWPIWTIFVALNVAAVLRAWPAIEGTGWLATERYWPMAAAGALALAALALFAWMFASSYLEQREPGWASPEALARKQAGARS
jgi:hypothetical protein